MNVDLELYSPRWGHDDTYRVDLQPDVMTITMQVRKATCTYQPNADPVWTGEPLSKILRNDSIPPLEQLTNLLEHAWLAWRGGEINDAEVAGELQLLADWINTITKNKPGSPFWKRYF